jgi:hypothetical protein
MTFQYWRPWRGLSASLLVGALLMMSVSTAQAHLMVAQRGTLNLQGNGAFVVLSVPVSAFPGVDDDGDGKLSQAELADHHGDMQTTVEKGLLLNDAQANRPLQGIFFTPTPPDQTPQAPADQVVVMARFALSGPIDDGDQNLSFTVKLFGSATAEQAFQIVVTQGSQVQLMVLTPEHSERAVFPSAWATFSGYIGMGTLHILTGMDHLLFLLVVLAASTRWRYIVLALTSFTLGHSASLLASLWGGFSVSNAVVEPAIAATIVGMALFDERLRRKAIEPPLKLRLGLVFLCSLVHGLGLASSLTELGLDNTHRLLSLAGFNIGIELGQLGVAILALAIYKTVRMAFGVNRQSHLLRLMYLAATGAGSVWFVTRILG